MTKAQLAKEIKSLKSNYSKYTQYKITTDLDGCNPNIIYINLNFYDAETDEYLDDIEYDCFEYTTDDDYLTALAKAEKAYLKLEALGKELNAKEVANNEYLNRCNEED